MSDNIPTGQVVQGRNVSEVETILGFLGASSDWYRFFKLAGERGCGRTTRDLAMAWFLPSDFLEEPVTDDRMEEMMFMQMAEDGAMTMVTFAINPVVVWLRCWGSRWDFCRGSCLVFRILLRFVWIGCFMRML